MTPNPHEIAARYGVNLDELAEDAASGNMSGYATQISYTALDMAYALEDAAQPSATIPTLLVAALIGWGLFVWAVL